MPRLLAAQLGVDPTLGDYNVLYIGDPRVLPVPGHEFADGIAYAVTVFQITSAMAESAYASNGTIVAAVALRGPAAIAV